MPARKADLLRCRVCYRHAMRLRDAQAVFLGDRVAAWHAFGEPNVFEWLYFTLAGAMRSISTHAVRNGIIVRDVRCDPSGVAAT